MFLIDTDVAIWVLRGHQPIIDTIDHLAGQAEVAISTITIAELYKNIFPSEVQNTEDFINHQIVLSVTSPIAKVAGYYWQEFHQQYAKLTLTDCLIAATAKSQQATLVTLNVRHFPMTDIQVMKP